MPGVSNDLLGLLIGCTMRLTTVPGEEWGTGFFVAPGLILTCAHVVFTSEGTYKTPQVYWGGQNYDWQPRLEAHLPNLDVALLRVKFSEHPCVFLHEAFTLGDTNYSYGYLDNSSNGDTVRVEYEGPTQLEGTDTAQRLLKLKDGQVRPGLSGAPLLNERTGGVCGIVRKSRDPDSDLGGRAIPISVVLSRLGFLIDEQKTFHRQQAGWLQQLTPQQLADGGRCIPAKLPSFGNGVTSQNNVAEFDEQSWATLIRAIKDGKCTPFLGSEVGSQLLPTRSEIAMGWATEFDYPLEDPHNLARVAQFLAVDKNPNWPKENLAQILSEAQEQLPNARAATEPPYSVLADLPLPIYITTNYDNLLQQALETRTSKRAAKNARREIFRWKDSLDDIETVFTSGYTPDQQNPVVFHLHGHISRDDSLVLTQDDYLDFLVNLARNPELNRIPSRISLALTRTYLLFLGYRLWDLEFWVLLRGLDGFLKKNTHYPGKAHISVQFVDTQSESEQEKLNAQRYLSTYCERLDIRVCWLRSDQFTEELKRRWENA